MRFKPGRVGRYGARSCRRGFAVKSPRSLVVGASDDLQDDICALPAGYGWTDPNSLLGRVETLLFAIRQAPESAARSELFCDAVFKSLEWRANEIRLSIIGMAGTVPPVVREDG